MECFITKDGIEKKAELEDILPLINDSLEWILRDANNSDIDLSDALAFTTDEIKNLVYSNLSLRIRNQVEQGIKYAESLYKKGDDDILNQKAKLISFIGKIKGWQLSEIVIWRKTKSEKDMSHVEKLIIKIENALNSGDLRIFGYDKISKDDVQSAFEAFLNRRNVLKKIQTFQIDAKYLPAAALLFETGAIENLTIYGKLEGTWPLFLENCQALKSISIRLNANKELTEFPSWIRNAVSLQSLSIDASGIANIPDWIGDLQSLTELSIGCININSKALPDSIGNLKKLTKLTIYQLATEKLPDSIGSLSSLKKFDLQSCDNLKTLPDSFGNLTNLEELELSYSSIEKLPDSIGALTNLSEFLLNGNKNLKYLPDSIGGLKNLAKLNIYSSAIEKLPDSIGSLSSLTEVGLYYCENFITLPDSLGNLTNLSKFHLCGSPIEKLPDSIGALKNLVWLDLSGSTIEKLPDSIGDLTNLSDFSLSDNKNLKYLPDSIGALKNMVWLDLSGSGIEKLPDTIINCSSLKSVDVCGTNIKLFPDLASTKITITQSHELIPAKNVISYRSFCSYYYKLAMCIISFNYKARREGLLALEDETEGDDFFMQGIRFVVDGTDAEIIKHILNLKIEREHDSYKKKLMEIALEGILDIQSGVNTLHLVFNLATLVDIKNNPLDAACAKYLAGDIDAIDNIDFDSSIQPEGEREEVRFIKRAMHLSEVSRREGLLSLDKHLDHDGIAARDVLEYSLPLLIDGWKEEDIDIILGRLIAFETEPARKNLALAKKDALEMIRAGYNSRMVLSTLLAYFDDSVKESFPLDFD